MKSFIYTIEFSCVTSLASNNHSQSDYFVNNFQRQKLFSFFFHVVMSIGAFEALSRVFLNACIFAHDQDSLHPRHLPHFRRLVRKNTYTYRRLQIGLFCWYSSHEFITYTKFLNTCICNISLHYLDIRSFNSKKTRYYSSHYPLYQHYAPVDCHPNNCRIICFSAAGWFVCKCQRQQILLNSNKM